jgi:hypothetical protein
VIMEGQCPSHLTPGSRVVGGALGGRPAGHHTVSHNKQPSPTKTPNQTQHDWRGVSPSHPCPPDLVSADTRAPVHHTPSRARSTPQLVDMVGDTAGHHSPLVKPHPQVEWARQGHSDEGIQTPYKDTGGPTTWHTPPAKATKWYTHLPRRRQSGCRS